jgi:hypothetical protein
MTTKKTPAPTSKKSTQELPAKKAIKKKLIKKKKAKKPAASKKPDRLMAKAFPMIEVIAEQVRTSIPPKLVEAVKSTKDKKKIISSSYPYERMMKGSIYDEQIKLLQIELVKMQSWVIQNNERIVMIFEGRDAAGKGGTIKDIYEVDEHEPQPIA